MGTVLRRYWLPALLSEEVAADGDPLRLRLLGEDLIAFRDTQGQVGLLGNHCPHRGASLFFGRNEEAGLRCVYHGWKFGADGTCLDMPNEPAESDFRTRVKAMPTPRRSAAAWCGHIWDRGPTLRPCPISSGTWYRTRSAT
jgi:phthalate 4,5-dioxygenase